MLKHLFKIMYAFILLAIGTATSVYFVRLAIASGHEPEIHKTESMFVDYVHKVETHYDSYKNMESHFHASLDDEIGVMEHQSNCLACHSLFPHEKNKNIRAFNNQHSRYMTCLACHSNANEYKWSDFGIDNSITRAGFYGLELLETGVLSGAENYISKIVPLKDNDALFQAYGDKSFQKELSRIDSIGDKTYLSLREKTEKHVSKKAQTCADCHSNSTEFPWDELGFSEDRVQEMKNNPVVNMLTKYDVFHFPLIYE